MAKYEGVRYQIIFIAIIINFFMREDINIKQLTLQIN
jgi:hypothetical protein